MDYQTKRDMMKRAFKWREDNKKKSDEEFYAQTLLVFMYIITIAHLYNINYYYNLEINTSYEECTNSKQDTAP
jgi:hypothetical protein